MITFEDLEEYLLRLPLSIGHEKKAQQDLEDHLASSSLTFTREHRLNAQDIPDFLIESAIGNVVVELKIRAQRKRIYKQMERYAEHDEVSALILITATPMGLPSTINGKPAGVISMGQGWL